MYVCVYVYVCVRVCVRVCMRTCVRARVCAWVGDLLEDEIGDGGVGVYDDGGHFVISDLLQQGGGVQAIIQHPDRQRLPGDQEATHQLLQS